jgi:DNA primase
MHQAGIENVISSSGTALTEDQIKVIKRFTNNLILLFDGDAAGLRAAERGVKMVLQAGMNLHVLSLPEGADPDSFVRKIGGEAFNEYLSENKQDFLSFKTRVSVEAISGDPFKKAELIKEIVDLIAVIPDAITRSVYFKACSSLLDIEEEVLVSDFNKKLRNNANKSSQERNNKASEYSKKPLSEREYIDGLVELNEFKSGDSQFKEKEILKSLLKFANVVVEDEEISVEMGEFLLDSISDIEFKTPELVQILEVFKQFRGKGKFPEDSDFLENEELSSFKNTVIDIISEKHSVSEHWSKHNIHVPSDEDILMVKVYADIYRLKWHKIRELQKETLEKIKLVNYKEESNEEEYIKLQKQFKELKRLEKVVTGELGNVIS